MMPSNGQEIRPTRMYTIGEPYEIALPRKQNPKELGIVTFAILTPPKLVFRDERYAAEVVLEDGTQRPMLWYPDQVRPRPGFWRRAWEGIVGNPLLAPAASISCAARAGQNAAPAAQKVPSAGPQEREKGVAQP
jgi:hypothetical protein